MKLGSLFDGIGGFPLAASRCGIVPVWASEIEPFPVSVTKRHFPAMLHLGDVTKVRGDQVEPVDIISFGSPCQDLSVAGKRSGLEGSRSGLFYEAVRIIEEMREATGGRYPTFALWENVPGAFSSNGGNDFRAVLEALAKAEVPMPRSGRWATAGMVRGNGRSLAWRVLDAQFWGVPQRRRRIFLIVDLGGERAPEILFESQGLRGDIAPSGKAGQDIAACVTTGTGRRFDVETETFVIQDVRGGTRDKTDHGQGIGIREDGPMYTLSVTERHGAVHPAVVGTLCASGAGMSRPAGMKSEADLVLAFTANQRDEVRDPGDKSGALAAQPGMKQQTFVAFNARQGPIVGGVVGALDTDGGTYGLVIPLDLRNATRTTEQSEVNRQGAGVGEPGAPAPTLSQMFVPGVAATIDCRNLYENEELSGTLQHKDKGGWSLNYINPVRQGYIVRRLTPLECERLQGFPDRWTDVAWEPEPPLVGKNPKRQNIPHAVRLAKATDTGRYKACGNSVAVPCVQFIMGRIAVALTAASGLEEVAACDETGLP